MADQKEMNSLQHKWNSILARAGLSVYAGTNHKLMYVECRSNTLDNFASASKHERCFVKCGRAGSNNENVYLQAAISGLTKRDKLFLDRYANMTTKELAALYRCTDHAIHCKVASIRRKLKRTATRLAAL